MIKLETHLHAIGGSVCADGNTELAVNKYKEAGYGAIVVITHYTSGCYKRYPGDTHKEKIDYFFKVYDDFAKVANAQNIKTFFGAEIRCLPTNTEYMLIGFDREFIYNNPPLFLLSQQQLFELAEENGFLMYQTHPFRTGVTVGDPKYMHGAESFNGHYHHYNSNEVANRFCEENHLIKLSGTDYHHDDQPISAGIYIPENIGDNMDLVQFIKKNNLKLIEDKELYQKAYLQYLERKKSNGN